MWENTVPAKDPSNFNRWVYGFPPFASVQLELIPEKDLIDQEFVFLTIQQLEAPLF